MKDREPACLCVEGRWSKFVWSKLAGECPAGLEEFTKCKVVLYMMFSIVMHQEVFGEESGMFLFIYLFIFFL